MADLIAFPQDRNVGKARHVAALWMQRPTQRARDVYWRSITRNLFSRLVANGFTPAQADRQLVAFCKAVQHQVDLIEARTVERSRPPQPDLAEAHRILDEGMQDIFDHNPNGAA